MVNVEEIKKRIAEAITQSGITQVKLAEKLHLTQSTIAHYIKGDILPSLETLANLCLILDIPPNYILCFEQ